MENQRGKNDDGQGNALARPFGHDISPLFPFCWRDVPREDWPYSSIEEEYVRSPQWLSAQILRNRWDGVLHTKALDLFSETQALKRQRFDYQREVLKAGLSRSLATDAEYQCQWLDDEIISIAALAARLDATIECGVEYVPSKASKTGYVQMPLSATGLSKLVTARLRCGEVMAERMGLAKGIAKSDEDGDFSLTEVLIERFSSMNMNLAGLVNRAAQGSMSMLERADKAAEAETEDYRQNVIEILPESVTVKEI